MGESSSQIPDRIENWDDFEVAIASLISVTFATDPTFLFRGQTKQHNRGLLPAIARHPKGFEVEQRLLQEFQKQAHLAIDRSWLPGPQERFEWWALMQHYGVPTRLLDWSVSPYVALYNACCDEAAVKGRDNSFGQPSEGVVYVAFAHRVRRQNQLDVYDEATYRANIAQDIHFAEARRASQRSSLQRGWFSVLTGSGSVSCHRQALEAVLWAHGDPENEMNILTVRPLTIPANQKIEFLRQLNFRGITG